MVDESMPKSWLIHDVKVTPKDAQNDPTGWEDEKPNDNSFVIQQCRVDSSQKVVSVPEGTAGNVKAIQGNYTLYIDAVNSFPLDRLPEVDDQVQWSDGYSKFSAVVQSVNSLYTDVGINHWEVILL